MFGEMPKPIGGKVARDIQYALSFSQFYYSGASAGQYIGYCFDTEGNKVENVAGTTSNDFVTIVLSGSSSSSSITVTANKAGYYNVFGRYYNGSATNVSTRAYKNAGDTIFTSDINNGTRYVYAIIWLEA